MLKRKHKIDVTLARVEQKNVTCFRRPESIINERGLY